METIQTGAKCITTWISLDGHNRKFRSLTGFTGSHIPLKKSFPCVRRGAERVRRVVRTPAAPCEQDTGPLPAPYLPPTGPLPAPWAKRKTNMG